MITTVETNELPDDLPDDPYFLKELIGLQREVIGTYATYTSVLTKEVAELLRRLENIENKRNDN